MKPIIKETIHSMCNTIQEMKHCPLQKKEIISDIQALEYGSSLIQVGICRKYHALYTSTENELTKRLCEYVYYLCKYSVFQCEVDLKKMKELDLGLQWIDADSKIEKSKVKRSKKVSDNG